MIYVNLMGGLGNQLFQYATARVQAKRLNTQVRVYFDDHYKLVQRKYGLSAYFPPELLIEQNTIAGLLPERGLTRRIKSLLGLKIDEHIFREKVHFQFDPSINSIEDNRLLIGFWQSYKYFDSIYSLLISELNIEAGLSQEARFVQRVISGSTCSVSLHIRRADYLNPNSGYYPLPLEYYYQGINLMVDRLGKIDVYIFSDDIEWCKNELDTKSASLHFIENVTFPHEDIFLMSICNHQIIANSSFSWWGAYLNKNPQKIVIAPNEWNRDVKIDKTDLILPDWIII